jgi:hypothetical protein
MSSQFWTYQKNKIVALLKFIKYKRDVARSLRFLHYLNLKKLVEFNIYRPNNRIRKLFLTSSKIS